MLHLDSCAKSRNRKSQADPDCDSHRGAHHRGEAGSVIRRDMTDNEAPRSIRGAFSWSIRQRAFPPRARRVQKVRDLAFAGGEGHHEADQFLVGRRSLALRKADLRPGLIARPGIPERFVERFGTIGNTSLASVGQASLTPEPQSPPRGASPCVQRDGHFPANGRRRNIPQAARRSGALRDDLPCPLGAVIERFREALVRTPRWLPPSGSRSWWRRMTGCRLPAFQVMSAGVQPRDTRALRSAPRPCGGTGRCLSAHRPERSDLGRRIDQAALGHLRDRERLRRHLLDSLRQAVEIGRHGGGGRAFRRYPEVP